MSFSQKYYGVVVLRIVVVRLRTCFGCAIAFGGVVSAVHDPKPASSYPGYNIGHTKAAREVYEVCG
jgi:hypothetical protein